MSIFDDQIRQRKLSDQELFEDSILRMASAVVGRDVAGSMASERIVTKEAVDDILKFYRINPVDIPAHVTDSEEQLEYTLRPHGIMHRMVALNEGWYKDAFGPMIVAIVMIALGYNHIFTMSMILGIISIILLFLVSPAHIKAKDDEYRKAAGKPLDDALVGRK